MEASAITLLIKEEIMETAILILILVLCLCLVYVTELMKKMCNQFNSFKDDNTKKWTEYSKEYSEVMELLLTKHNEINELHDQLKSLEDKIKENEDDNAGKDED